MDQLRVYGDERQLAQCIYCGGETETRDHVPSRILLDKPYPSNLPVVFACQACNEGFSIDEEYVACLVECTLAGSVEVESIRRDKIRRILRKKPKLVARLAQARVVTETGTSFRIEEDRVRNVVVKLARGHAAYELHDPHLEDPLRLSIAPLETMPMDAREDFESPPEVSIWPEVGSRAMQRRAAAFRSEPAPGWIIVQPGRYRYLASVGDAVLIRVVLSEYMGCEVVWG